MPLRFGLVLQKLSLWSLPGSRQKLLAESNDERKIKLENQLIRRVDHTKSRGLINENRLSWFYFVFPFLRGTGMFAHFFFQPEFV